MNETINFRRIGISLILALVAASLTFAIGLAATYEYSESTLYWISGPSTPTSINNAGCRGNYCKYLVQDNYNPSAWRWTQKSAAIMYWEAYCPTIGEAAARYGVREINGASWYQTMNQANPIHQGTFVYIGDSSSPYQGGYMMLHNGCIAGWWCGGLDVYWDNVLYLEDFD
ncbi:MAG: hypothetical protein PVF83_10250 [Anaerolineales bacterium]|jgi:hypothetical protein